MADVTRDDVHLVQAAAEGVELDDDNRVEFMGAWFRMSDRVGLMPLLKFGFISKQGVGAEDLEGMAAMYAMLRDCIDTSRPQKPVLDEFGEPVLGDDGQPVTEDDGESEWDRFERHAIDNKAEGEDLFKVIPKVIERLSARPTKRPAVSSAGSRTTSASSKAISSSTADSPGPTAPQRRRPPEVDEMVPVTSLLDRRLIA